VFGRVGATEVDARGLSDAQVQRLVPKVTLSEDFEFSRSFPAERWARVRIVLADGRRFASEPACARGNPENPLSDAELRAKFHELAVPALGPERAARIERAVDALGADRAVLRALLEDLLQPAVA
jgi:2-methylcitrate dehydratase PrpD